MALDMHYEFERFEEFYGDIKQVKKILNHCPICGGELLHSHITDYGNLLVQESAICPDCGNNPPQRIHILN